MAIRIPKPSGASESVGGKTIRIPRDRKQVVNLRTDTNLLGVAASSSVPESINKLTNFLSATAQRVKAHNDKLREQEIRNFNTKNLSLLTKAIKNGPNYIYSLLTGYEESPPKGFELTDGLYYNPYYDGKVIAMPPPLYDNAIEYIDGTNASLDQLSYDIVHFLNWAAEPKLQKRKSLGLKVLLFLIVLTLLLYVTMKEIWSRIEK